MTIWELGLLLYGLIVGFVLGWFFRPVLWGCSEKSQGL